MTVCMKNFSEEESKEIKKPNYASKAKREGENKVFTALEEEKTSEDAVEELYKEKREELKERELLIEKERAIREKLKEETAKMELIPNLREEAKEKAIQIRSLDKKGKLQRLLDIAEEKGVTFAMGVVKSMKDPYILDAFHDILARDELYKKFKK